MSTHSSQLVNSITGSLQLAAQIAASFTPYEDSLQQLSFGLGVLTDLTPSNISKVKQLRLKKTDTNVKYEIAATALHYSNLINQFFPIHPFLSIGLMQAELSMGFHEHQNLSEYLSNLTYTFLQVRHAIHFGRFETTFYGNLRTHSDLKKFQNTLVKIHPSAKKIKLGYMTLPMRLWAQGATNPLSKNITLTKTTSDDMLNTVLHEFAHTFDTRFNIPCGRCDKSHDEHFADMFRMIYLKAWAHNELPQESLIIQRQDDSGYTTEKRFTEKANFQLYRFQKLHAFLESENIDTSPFRFGHSHNSLMNTSSHKRFYPFHRPFNDFEEQQINNLTPDLQNRFRQYIINQPLNKITSSQDRRGDYTALQSDV